MGDDILVNKKDLEDLVKLLEVIHLEAGLVSWDTECSKFLDKLEFEITQIKLLLEYNGE